MAIDDPKGELLSSLKDSLKRSISHDVWWAVIGDEGFLMDRLAFRGSITSHVYTSCNMPSLTA